MPMPKPSFAAPGLYSAASGVRGVRGAEEAGCDVTRAPIVEDDCAPLGAAVAAEDVRSLSEILLPVLVVERPCGPGDGAVLLEAPAVGEAIDGVETTERFGRPSLLRLSEMLRLGGPGPPAAVMLVVGGGPIEDGPVKASTEAGSGSPCGGGDIALGVPLPLEE